MSRIEKMMKAIIDETSYDEEPQSRIEKQLISILKNEPYEDDPKSRIEVLIELVRDHFSGDGDVATSTETTASLPLTLIGNGKLIKNYRIYGNTVDGESVGDLVTVGEHTNEYHIPINVEGANLFDVSAKTLNRYIGAGGGLNISSTSDISDYIPVTAGTTLTLSWDYVSLLSSNQRQIGIYDETKQYFDTLVYRPPAKTYTFQIPENARYIRMTVDKGLTEIMLNRGATALPYEPYTTPVTTDIFVSEPIGMTDGNADYIDYKTQKRYNADGTSESVMLPAIRTVSGTNVLLFGTAVQPSKMTLPVETTFQFNEESEDVDANATLQTAQINSLQSLDNLQFENIGELSQEDNIVENAEEYEKIIEEKTTR